MADPKPGLVVTFRLRPDRAERIVHEIAMDTKNVIIGNHALIRLAEREISDIELYRLLQTGHVTEEPTRTKRKEWKCKVVKQLKGNREAGAITIILHNGKLFVKTVEWEDLRS